MKNTLFNLRSYASTLKKLSVIAIDSSGIIRFVDDTTEKILGYQATDLLNTNASNLFSVPLEEILEGTIDGMPYTRESNWLKKNGEKLQVFSTIISTTSKPLLEENFHGLEESSFAMVCLSISSSSPSKILRKQEFIATLLQATSEIIYVYDVKKSVYIFLNRKVGLMLGYNQSEANTIEIANAKELLHPFSLPIILQHTERVYKLINKTQDNQRIHRLESRWKRKNGNYNWVECQEVDFSYDKNGKPTFFIGIAQDIREFRKADNRLRKNKELFELSLKASNDGIWNWDLVTDKLYISPRWKEMLKYEDDEIQNDLHALEVFFENNNKLEVFKKLIDYRWNKIDQFNVIEKYDDKYGQPVFISSKAVKLKGKNGDDIRIVVSNMDVTELKLAELRLKESQQKLIEAQKIARIGSWKIDLLSNEMIFSTQFFNIYGITDEEERKNFTLEASHYLHSKYIHPEDLDEVIDAFSLVQEDYSSLDIEHRIISAKGEIIYLHVIGTYVYDEKGIPLMFYGTVQDISDRKLREIELINAKQKAEEATKEKAQFLSTMSHEIRTPMNAVIGLTHLLLDEDPKDGQIKNLKTLKFSAENLLVLINDILDFSKIEAGKISLEKIDFNLKELMHSIHHAMQYKADEKGITLKIEVEKNIPHFLIGDPVRINQILTNLVSNAVKFTDKGYVLLKVSIKDKTAKKVTLNFSVKDTGIGIPKEKQAVIFDSFTQASANTTRKFGGTGLGLAITKNLLELQNSKIEIDSKEGQGSEFNFTLSFEISEKKYHKRINLPSSLSTPKFDNIKLLLVEDNTVNQMVATQFLRKWGINPDFAINGKEAINKILNNDYDVVLMDIIMPDIDGYEVTKTIRSQKDKKYKNLPIIALTADAFHEVKDLVIDAGMNDYVSKPFSPNDLYKKIAHYIDNDKVSLVKKKKKKIDDSTLQLKSNNENNNFLSFKRLDQLSAGSDDFLQQIIEKYIDLFQNLDSKYEEALFKQDYKGLRFLAHDVKSTLEILAINEIKTELNVGKKLLQSKKIEKAKIKQSVKNLKLLVSKTISLLERKKTEKI